jgi:hypothetical protein
MASFTLEQKLIRLDIAAPTSYAYLMDPKSKKSELPSTPTEIPVGVNRREFLNSILRTTGQITIASGAIYTVTMITSKNGNTAGAK